ncbi:MAG: nucleotidyltransferase domain-containing protein, partial [Candidatus Hydrogenedentes bacterium]|nr:nucleotidyltransferase domain-containing protein [Candidatus Hydrogenedentota bacterium]
MSDAATFTDLVDLARGRELSAEGLTRQACLQATRSFYEERRARIREGHAEKSGSHVVHDLSDLADEMLRGVFGFAVASLGTRRHVLSRIALCALGGYGRGELSPHSDLDVCLLHEGESKIQVESLSEYLVPFLWDIGCRIGFVTRTIDETLELARRDMTAYTSLLESRLIAGESSVFARIKLSLRDLQTPDLYEEFVRVKLHERFEKISDEDKELYRPEPNVKEGAGGLRDFHTAIWLFTMAHGAHNIDEVVAQGVQGVLARRRVGGAP